VLGAVVLLLVVILASQVKMVLLRWLVVVAGVLDAVMVSMDSVAEVSLFSVVVVIVAGLLVVVSVGVVVGVGVVCCLQDGVLVEVHWLHVALVVVVVVKLSMSVVL